MRLIKVVARNEKEKKEIEEILSKKKIVSYQIITGKGFYSFEILATDEESGHILGRLEEKGFGKSFDNSIVVLDVRASVPSRKRKELAPRISAEELEEDIKKGSTLDWVYLGFISLASIIIAFGLLGNNVIVVIGGMVIAPLLYPIIGSSYYLLKGNLRKLRRTLHSEIWGMLLAILWGIIISGIVKISELNSLLIGRSTPSVFDIGIAIFSGAAGALSVSTRNLGEFSGVAIAVALIPPAVTIGLGIGMGNLLISVGAAGVTLINVICVHISSILTFSILGYDTS
ncbi:MAG: TIGR00341 family protein [Nanoarchaeota archaeon]|nr:TIGR00341 family protein [Nanoarchaeota archaeon]